MEGSPHTRKASKSQHASRRVLSLVRPVASTSAPQTLSVVSNIWHWHCNSCSRHYLLRLHLHKLLNRDSYTPCHPHICWPGPGAVAVPVRFALASAPGKRKARTRPVMRLYTLFSCLLAIHAATAAEQQHISRNLHTVEGKLWLPGQSGILFTMCWYSVRGLSTCSLY